MIPQSKFNKQYTKKKGNQENEESGFPDYLANRTVVSKNNIVWQMDGTFLNTSLVTEPKSKHFLLLAVDVATNRLVFTKVFYSKDDKKTCTSQQVIKTLTHVLKEYNLKEDLVIHTDKGSQFTSKKYVYFINKTSFLIGSQTCGGHPQGNAVVERINRTFKNQGKHLGIVIPQTVKQTRDLQNIRDKRRLLMNKDFLSKKNHGLTANEMGDKLDQNKAILPEILLTHNTFFDPPHNALTEIKKYRKVVRFAGILNHNPAQNQIDQIQGMGIATQNLVVDLSDRGDVWEQKMDTILEHVTPKPKRSHKAQILKDPVPKTVLEEIINDPKPKGSHEKTWALFQLACAVMFFTGLRINEVVGFDTDTFKELFETDKITIYQSKVNKHRCVFFSDTGRETIQMVFNKTKHIIYDTDKVLFPRPVSNRNNVEKLNGLVNKYLSFYAKKHHFKFTSHSFRTGYVSTGLKHSTAHRVQELIGHADIRSTMKYSRFVLEAEEKDELLTKMFD